MKKLLFAMMAIALCACDPFIETPEPEEESTTEIPDNIGDWNEDEGDYSIGLDEI